VSNVINKNHPFRASTTHDKSSVSESGLTSSGGTQSRDSSSDESSKFRLSTRSKVIGACITFGVLGYGWTEVYDAVYAGPSDSAISNKRSISQDVEDDWEYQGNNRSVEEARNSVGFLSKVFCRGGRRSAICD
jgi:hypothetical protein